MRQKKPQEVHKRIFSVHVLADKKKILAGIKDKSRTHSSRELELKWRALKEGGAVVIAASYKAVRTLLPYIYAVDYFGVASQIPDCGAAVPEEDGSKPRERAELL